MNRHLLFLLIPLLLTGPLLPGCSESDEGEEEVARIEVNTGSDTAQNRTPTPDESATDQTSSSERESANSGDSAAPDASTSTEDTGRSSARDRSPSTGTSGESAKKATVGIATGVDGDPLPSFGEVDYSMVSLPAPNITWKNVDGSRGSLKDYRGSVLLVNFWGTWCAPCRRELPDIVSVRREFGPKGFEVIGVAVNERPTGGRSIPQNLAAFAEVNGLEYPLVVDDSKVSAGYGQPPSVPTTFVIDRKGRVVNVLVGARSAEEFRKVVAPHL